MRAMRAMRAALATEFAGAGQRDVEAGQCHVDRLANGVLLPRAPRTATPARRHAGRAARRHQGAITVILNGPPLAAACATASFASSSGKHVTSNNPRSSNPPRTSPAISVAASVGYIHLPRSVMSLRMIHGYGNSSPRAAEHADAAHQHHAPVGPHRHHRGAHRRRRHRRRHQVDHAVDRPRCRLLHAGAIGAFIAGQRDGAHAFAEAAREIREHTRIAAGRDHALRTHRQRHRDACAAEVAGRAAHEHDLARAQIGREQPAVRHEHRIERAPARGIGRRDLADAHRVLGRHAHPFGKRPIVEMALQLLAAFAACAPALQHDVGHPRIVARAHGRIAEHPVTGPQLRRIRAALPDPADGAAARHDRQRDRIAAFAAEHFLRVGQNRRRDHVHDDLAGAEHRVRHRFDRERRAERLQNRSFHEVS